MLTRLRGYLWRNLFDRSLPFECRLYMVFLIVSFGLSALSLGTNLALGSVMPGWAVPCAYAVLCLVLLALPMRQRLRWSRPMLVFVALVYVPFMFFQTGGYDGTALFFSPLAVFMLTIVFKGRTRIALVSLCIAMNVGMVVCEQLWPGLVAPMGKPASRLLDIATAVLFTLTAMALMAYYVSNTFDTERARIADLSVRDPLTGVYNRRFLNERLEISLAESQQSGLPLCALMMDLDLFKRINDTYGHAFGDIVLKRFAAIAQANLREYDMLARYGGEEFVAVLNHVHTDKAQDVAERIRAAVEAETFHYGTIVTVSIGIAESRPGDDCDTLISRADERLYEAKNTGRNRVAA